MLKISIWIYSIKIFSVYNTTRVNNWDMSHFPGGKHVFNIYVAYFYLTYMINGDLFYSLIFSFLGETIRILMIISIGFKIDISRHSWQLYTKTPDPMSKLDQGLSIGARVYIIRSNSHIVTIDQSMPIRKQKTLDSTR